MEWNINHSLNPSATHLHRLEKKHNVDLNYIRNVHITGDARGHESSRNIDAKQPYVPVVKLEVNAITHECGMGEDVVHSRRNCLFKTSSIRTQRTQSSGCVHLPRQRKERNRKGPKPAQFQPANSSHSTTVALHIEQPFRLISHVPVYGEQTAVRAHLAWRRPQRPNKMKAGVITQG